MHEDALSFAIGSLQVFHYGLWVAAGALLMLLMFHLTARRKGLGNDIALVFGAVALPLSLICSRLLFCALDFRFHGVFSLRALLSFWGGGFSMSGALIGIALSALIVGRIQKTCPLKILDCLTPALMLFIACARMGEGATELLGRSRPLVSTVFNSTFLASTDGYDYYLNTYMLEALTALVLFGVLVYMSRSTKPAGEMTLLAMLLFGCTQCLWESLRFDSHMRKSFISMQQIFFAALFAVPLFFYAWRGGKKKLLLCAIGLVAIVLGGVVGLEFLIDRSGFNRFVLYAIYALILTLPAVAALKFKKRSIAP